MNWYKIFKLSKKKKRISVADDFTKQFMDMNFPTIYRVIDNVLLKEHEEEKAYKIDGYEFEEKEVNGEFEKTGEIAKIQIPKDKTPMFNNLEMTLIVDPELNQLIVNGEMNYSTDTIKILIGLSSFDKSSREELYNKLLMTIRHEYEHAIDTRQENIGAPAQDISDVQGYMNYILSAPEIRAIPMEVLISAKKDYNAKIDENIYNVIEKKIKEILENEIMPNIQMYEQHMAVPLKDFVKENFKKEFQTLIEKDIKEYLSKKGRQYDQ